MRKNIFFICIFFFLTMGFLNGVYAQNITGLPLNLEFFMSKERAKDHLKSIDLYRVEDAGEETLAYLIPAPDSKTTNGLFLDFSEDKLIRISSMKSEMNAELYQRYLHELLTQAQEWKAAGMEIVIEDQNSNTYAYKDLKNVVTISGSPVSGSESKFMVTISFTEIKYDQQKKSGID